MKRILSPLVFVFCLVVAGAGSAQTSAQYLNAGNQLYSSGDYAKAAQYYEAAVSMDPNSSAAYQGLGNCRYYQGDKVGALQAYEKALAIDPGNAQLATFAQSLRSQVGSSPSAQPSYSSTSSSSKTKTSSSDEKSFEFDVMAGLAMSTAEGYGIGFGGGAAGRMPIGGGLSIGGSAGFYTFGSSESVPGLTVDSSVGSLEVLGSGKYVFPGGGGGLVPYAVGGVGISVYMTSLTVTYDPDPFGFSGSASASSIYPMIQAGGGVSFPAGDSLNLFGEAKFSLLIGDGGTWTYIPFTFGASFGF